MSAIAEQARRRRTFAIISHPDAGKTTLTEKLLLYGGAIHLAGSVKSRKASRHAISDWMEMEKTRGISITSSVLQFEHMGKAVNLLDTPGHADFSEDTYRTLSAVDSAVMLIDHAKGVESRTLKLFEVCRLRGLPILTFINKLDRPGLDPLELMDEVTEALGGLRCTPVNWPIGMGKDFAGVVRLSDRMAFLFGDSARGTKRAESELVPWDSVKDELGALGEQVDEELELLQEAGDGWDHDAFLRGDLTPVFFGSAMTNFGVAPFLDFLVENAPGPAARTSEADEVVAPTTDRFTGFVFKIQANMNPRHRDRIAFMRVVSGQFERGMDVKIGRSGETLRLSKPHSFMAQERSIVEEAWPGDIVGLYDPGKLRIGDTIAANAPLKYRGIPRFAPEHFARVELKDPLKRKQLQAGLTQLSHEGAIQLFYRAALGRGDPYLGAVGMLQFEVLKERLLKEYRVQCELSMQPFRLARWVGGDPKGLEWLKARRDYHLVEDRNGDPVIVAESIWPLQYAQRENPGLELFDVEPL
jgi:peptide chain release factor 3